MDKTTTITGFKTRNDLVSRLDEAKLIGGNLPVRVVLPGSKDLFQVYPASVLKSKKGGVFMAGTFNQRKYLFLVSKANLKILNHFKGKVVHEQADFVIKKCRISRSTLDLLRGEFPFCDPVRLPSGNRRLAFGDTLGLAGRSQLRTFSGLADLTISRQCIHQMREMELHPNDALDSATWTVFQEGYEKGFAAEACHIGTVTDLKEMLKAGYTRFSIEPTDMAINDLRQTTKRQLLDRIMALPWIALRDKFELVYNRYRGESEVLDPIGLTETGAGSESDSGIKKDTDTRQKQDLLRRQRLDPEQRSLVIQPGEGEILLAIVMFSETILQIEELENVLFAEGVRDKVTLEISFERCGEALTPFEHYFVISELLRRDVQPDYIAPGCLEHGHMLLAQQSGRYGLSGRFNSRIEWQRFVEEKLLPGVPLHGHLPDISYVTALQCIVSKEKKLFRRIWETSRNRFESVKHNHDTALKIDHIESSTDYSDDSLPNLLERPYAKEFLTITMPEIMTIRNSEGDRFLRQKLYHFLYRHEDEYTNALQAEYARIE